jgi:hypothetical protein
MGLFSGFLHANDVAVSGALTCAGSAFRLWSTTQGWVTAGVVTAYTGLQVGSDNAKFTVTGDKCGIGTATPRAKLDVDGAIKIKTSSENVHALSISAGNVDVDLSKAQSFTLHVTSEVTQFTLVNPPDDATAFTIKFEQNTTGYSVDIDDFRDISGSAINVYWPAGGVIPIVTTDPSRIDIYSFKTFDSGASLYGIVGGQNFVA